MYGRLALTFALALLVSAPGASAQSAQPESDNAPPAHVSYVQGGATLERDGRPETAPLNMPLLTGDRIKTAGGRVEVLFGDGSTLHLDAQSTLDIQSDDLVRLIDGRLRLTIAGRAAAAAYRVDSPAGSVRIAQAGEYRIALLRRSEEVQLELAVVRGAGEIFTDEGQTPVRAGERAYASAGLAPSYAYAYNSANWDAFDRWAESRRDARLGVSAQYLPSEVRPYASTFDEDGDWRYQQSYGYVWYPRVDVSWRPYYFGRWAQYPRYGWTWIGADRFAWPTHHYGRWGFSANAWFWIPAARWAPAYVSWAYAPGYVSWCPLGFDNRPVISVNIFNAGPGYYSSARAWTSVGSTHFGREYVHQRAVNWDRSGGGRRPSFQVGQGAPAYRDVAVPRGSAPLQSPARSTDTRTSSPIGWAGSRTVPAERGGNAAPRYTNRGDEIVRSQTVRPAPRTIETPGAPVNRSSPADSPRQGYAVQRTAPAGPARRVEPPSAAPEPSAGAVERWSGARDPYAGRYAPRQPAQVPGQRPDAPAYQPRPYAPPPRGPQPAEGSGGRSRVPPSGSAAPDPGPASPPSHGYARPRGGSDPRPPAPATAAPRQAPAPERPAPSSGTAVPRRGRGGV